MARLVFFCFCISRESFHANTRLIATASTSSRMPSSSRKLSKLDPLWSKAIFLPFSFFHVFPPMIGVYRGWYSHRCEYRTGYNGCAVKIELDIPIPDGILDEETKDRLRHDAL